MSTTVHNSSNYKSQQLLHLAEKVIPGGVNSPVRSFSGVGGAPVFFERGQGPYLYSADGERYIDYIGSWGPMILGHCNPDVVEALKLQAECGLSFGAPTELEVKLANKIVELIPSIEKVRLVNSGTEATMSAIRLARGYTKKNKIIKFIGCYHGHSDNLLVQAGSGLLTLNNTTLSNNTAPSSAGVPDYIVQDTLLAEYNNLDSVTQLFEKYSGDIAAVIIEPVPGNMNLILPENNFLQGLRDICTQYNSVLIFDEVMSGFRVGLTGAQGVYNIQPDLTTLGKVIGGGLPVGAFGGRAEIMDCLAPVGQVYQAGTLSGNPLATTAGLVTLNKISQPGFYEQLSVNTRLLVQGLTEIMKAHNINFFAHSLGSMFGMFFLKNEIAQQDLKISNFKDVANKCSLPFFKQFFHAMLNQGVYLAPSMYEAGFVSVTHTKDVINQTLLSTENAVKTF